MKDNRYSVIKTYMPESWVINSPANVVKWQLIRDLTTNKTLLRSRYFNSSKKAIKTVYVSVTCFDDAKDLLTKYTDIIAVREANAAEGTEFQDDSKLIVIDEVNTTYVEISIEKVTYTDESVWRKSDSEIVIVKTEKNEIQTSASYYDQIEYEYKEGYGKNCPIKYWYNDFEHYWVCGCGQINEKEKSICCRCKTSVQWLKEHLDIARLEEAKCKREKEEAFARKQCVYQKALSLIGQCKESDHVNVVDLVLNTVKYKKAWELLKTIPSFEDSEILASKIESKTIISVEKVINSLKDKKTIAVIGIIVVFLSLILFSTLKCKHLSVTRVTCTQASVCTQCGKIMEEPKGHHYSKLPTCTSLAYCQDCNLSKSIFGEDDNTTLEHIPDRELTCVDPAKCTRCNSDIPPLGHDWEPATCTTVQTCRRCEITEGEPLGHTRDYETCVRCNEVLGEVIFKDSYVTVYHVGTKMSSNLYVHLVIENNTEAGLTVQTRDEKLNGKPITAIFSEYVPPNSKNECVININSTFVPLSEYGVRTMDDIKSLVFKLYFNNYKYNYFTSKPINLNVKYECP